MSYKCEVREQAAQPTLAIRVKTTAQALPQLLAKAYGAIAQYLAEAGEQAAGPPFVAYYTLDMQALEVEIGFPIAKELAGKGEIQAGVLPSGLVATCLYTGPYHEMAPAYDALSQWIHALGSTATGVAYEHYLNDPSQTPPQALQTELVFPLKTTA